MSSTSERSTVLVPINAAETETPPLALVELLHPLRLIVLGYYPVPDQASPEQLRAEYEAEATEAVQGVTEQFADYGADVESVVVFTRDRSETIDRVADEHDVDAVLTAGSVGETLDQVFVPLRGDETLDRIIGFVGDLLRESAATVTFYNVSDDEDAAARAELVLRGACDQLEERGIDPDRLDWRQERAESPGDAIVDAAGAYDLLVVGESDPSLTDRILGNVTGNVIEGTTHPVLVVRNT